MNTTNPNTKSNKTQISVLCDLLLEKMSEMEAIDNEKKQQFTNHIMEIKKHVAQPSNAQQQQKEQKEQKGGGGEPDWHDFYPTGNFNTASHSAYKILNRYQQGGKRNKGGNKEGNKGGNKGGNKPPPKP